MKFCSKCGNQIADDAVFCYECGARQDTVQNYQPQPRFSYGVPQHGASVVRPISTTAGALAFVFSFVNLVFGIITAIFGWNAQNDYGVYQSTFNPNYAIYDYYRRDELRIKYLASARDYGESTLYCGLLAIPLIILGLIFSIKSFSNYSKAKVQGVEVKALRNFGIFGIIFTATSAILVSYALSVGLVAL